MGMMVFSNNLTDPAQVANASVSSAKSAFPVSNLYDLSRRKRVWRSDGYFNIPTGSETLIFRDAVGVDLIATIAVQAYTSDSSFRTALEAAINAAGAANYTVVRDNTTNRIKITSDLSGGATVFQLRLTDPLSAGLAAILGYDTSTNLTGAAFYEGDTLVIHTSEWLLWDLGFPTNPTGFFAVGDRTKGLKISPSSTVKLQANWTNSWTSPPIVYTIPYRDFIFALTNKDGLADIPAGYRYWRMQISDPQNTYGYVELGALSLGMHLVLSRGCPEFPLEIQNEDASNVAYAEGGQTFSKRNFETERFQLNWRALDTASLETLKQFFDLVGKRSPFFIAMDPNDAFSTDGKTYCRLVRFVQDPVERLETPGNWAFPWQLREEL